MADGTVDLNSGGFTPAPVPTDAELNPYVDAGPWGAIFIGALQLPGVVASVDGAEKPEEWSVQKGTSSSGATTVWKGTKLAESIKIALKLHDANSAVQYYVLRDTLRPQIGKKPPSHLIINPQINFNGIISISVKNIAPPKWVPAGGYWDGSIELIEYNPSKPANAGPATGAWKDSATHDPNADVKAALQGALDAAAKA